MTVLYVDVEHESVLHDPERAAGHASRLEVARNRLAIEAGEPCTVVRFDEVSEDSVSELEPSAVVLSGTTVEWQEYDFGSLQGLIDVIRSAPVPILGICAGHQLIGHAHGASWGPLDLLREGERDPDPRFGAGMRKERGFLPVEINSDCILFRGLGKPPRFFQTHYWHLRDARAARARRARTEPGSSCARAPPSLPSRSSRGWTSRSLACNSTRNAPMMGNRTDTLSCATSSRLEFAETTRKAFCPERETRAGPRDR